MRSEFFFDFCFVRESVRNEDFVVAVEKHLERLFSGKGHWHMDGKQEGHLDIVVAEVQGMESWEKEEDALSFLEAEAMPLFWQWLQGYRIQIDVKEHADCSHCGMR